MNKTVSATILSLVLAFLTLSAAGQEKSAAPKPADSPSQAVLAQWNDIGRKLIAMAEDFPEDKFDFKPTPVQGSFIERMLHAAGVNYFFTNITLGQKPPAEEAPK